MAPSAGGSNRVQRRPNKLWATLDNPHRALPHLTPADLGGEERASGVNRVTEEATGRVVTPDQSQADNLSVQADALPSQVAPLLGQQVFFKGQQVSGGQDR